MDDRTNSTPPDPSELVDPDGPPDVAPLSRRIGRLAIIVAGAVVVALGLNAVLLGPEEPAAEPPADSAELGISPAEMPRGALAGEPAPTIRLVMFDGATFDLAEHVAKDGRPIVLNFWASWCFPCRTEMPEFDDVARAHPEVQFLGIAVEDAVGPAREFAEEIQVSYPLGIDESGAISQAYPHVGLPTTYLINGNGTVARQVQGQLNGRLLEAMIEFDFG